MKRPIPQKVDTDSQFQDEGDGSKKRDFMSNVRDNTRFYTHQLRRGFTKVSPRIDFTQTLAFVSG